MLFSRAAFDYNPHVPAVPLDGFSHDIIPVDLRSYIAIVQDDYQTDNYSCQKGYYHCQMVLRFILANGLTIGVLFIGITWIEEMIISSIAHYIPFQYFSVFDDECIGVEGG